MTRPTRSQPTIDAEIIREKAEALGRAGERLERALAETSDLARRLDAAKDSADYRRLLAEYRAARTRAVEARMFLVIQREAIGLRQHRMVDQQFPEPPARTPACESS